MADDEQQASTVFSAYPLDQLDRVKEKGYEYKVVHLVRHAQGALGGVRGARPSWEGNTQTSARNHEM